MEVAIVGAGVAGLTCARRLVAAGHRVVLFDKGRFPGGRVSTRERDGMTWDHGAPGVTAAGWTVPGVRWVRWGEGRVAVPHMRSLGLALADGLDVRMRVRVDSLGPQDLRDGHWHLRATTGEPLGIFPLLVFALPPLQLRALVAAVAGVEGLISTLERAVMQPQLTLMVSFGSRVEGPPVLRPTAGLLELILFDSDKPGRPGDGNAWVAHSTSAYAAAHLEEPPTACRQVLLEALAAALGPLPAARYATVHRWRYARVSSPAGEPSWFDPTLQLGACGDWCLGADVEHAIRSGEDLAARLLSAGL